MSTYTIQVHILMIVEKNPYKFSNKLLGVIFLLWEISYGLVILSHDFDGC